MPHSIYYELSPSEIASAFRSSLRKNRIECIIPGVSIFAVIIYLGFFSDLNFPLVLLLEFTLLSLYYLYGSRVISPRQMTNSKNLMNILHVDIDPQKYHETICLLENTLRLKADRAFFLSELGAANYYLGQAEQAESYLNQAKASASSQYLFRVYNLLAICALDRNDLGDYDFYLNRIIKLHKRQKPNTPQYTVSQTGIDFMRVRKKPISQWDENDKNEIINILSKFKPEDNALMIVGLHQSLAKYEIQQDNPKQTKHHLDYVLQYQKPSRYLTEAQELLKQIEPTS